MQTNTKVVGASGKKPTPTPTPATYVTITNPLDGAKVSRNSTVNIVSNTSANIYKVDFYVNNLLVCSVITPGPFNCNWTVGAKSGAHYALTAIATVGSPSGFVIQSNVVNVTAR